MSKTVVLSFDDGREDTYTNAWPILKQYGLGGTINVVTDFILHPKRYQEFSSGGNRAMTVEQLAECQQDGMELACHGSTHQNTVEDVLKNITELREMGVSVENIGFASPHSELTLENSAAIRALVEQGTLSYIRTGIQVRREGLRYAGLTALERRSHSKGLFYRLNRKNILPPAPGTFLRSVAVTRYTTLEQLRYLIDRMADGESVILMFHSVLFPGEPGYGADTWYWDAGRFDALCDLLAQAKDISVRTTQQLVLDDQRGLRRHS